MASPNSRTTSVARTIRRAPEPIWALVRSGADVHQILPAVIKTCRLEGNRRFCTTEQGPLEETILTIDDEARLFRYRIDHQTLMPLERYEGSIHVTGTADGWCEVLWFATYELTDPSAEAAVREGLRGLFATAIDNMVGVAR